jgi:CBS domain-containing protein
MLTAADIMNPNVVTITGLATIAQATQAMRQNQIRHLIVERNHPHDAYGILTATDIVSKVIAYGRDPKTIRVYEIMTKPCISVNPDLAVEYVARLFSQSGSLHSAPVIKDTLLGIISIEDLITKSDFLEQPKEVFFANKMQIAIQQARAICEEKGHAATECIEAWAIVGKLEAETAYQQSTKIEKTALEVYLEENPQAVDPSIIENWCSG